jgi:hypothetical protein
VAAPLAPLSRSPAHGHQLQSSRGPPNRHCDEPALAALILAIASIIVWNRLNVATRQVAGAAWG